MSSRGARAYLECALRDAGVDLATASRAVFKNHAYLQQYIRSGRPKWLPEQVRNALVTLYGVDPEPLRPPPLEVAGAELEGGAVADDSGSDSQDESDINPQGIANLIDQPSLIELIGLWGAITEDQRQLTLSMLRYFAGR